MNAQHLPLVKILLHRNSENLTVASHVYYNLSVRTDAQYSLFLNQSINEM